MTEKDDIQTELRDIREILGTIVCFKYGDQGRIERVQGGYTYEFNGKNPWRNFRDVRNDIAQLRKETEFELDDLEGRVKYVEQKLGIQKVGGR